MVTVVRNQCGKQGVEMPCFEYGSSTFVETCPLTESRSMFHVCSMQRLHIDDLEQMMPRDHFTFMRRWLEQHNALIVQPDDVRVPHGSMGNFDSRRGRWGEDEPYPPFGGYRKLVEDARANPPGAVDAD
jgi:hypothetical protein